MQQKQLPCHEAGLWRVPAGLGLYWTISNLFGILQQVILSKHYKKKFAEEAAQ